MSAAASVAAPLSPWASETLVFCSDASAGLRAVIAIDSTTLGPALGGVRLKAYPSDEHGAREAQRLAAAMTLKNAVAGLPFGGGKSVIFDTGEIADRAALMRAFGEAVARLGGAYLPGVDMGTAPADLQLMRAAGATVSCADEDPSPWTAMGVYGAIRAAVEHVDRTTDLRGLRVLVQGAGHVGAALARQLAGDGAHVLIADVAPGRATAIAREVGGEVIAPDAVVETECDVFAPCAAAGVIGPEQVASLGCRIVAGAANDTITDDTLAASLRGRGVLYVPDFVANAGGVIHIHALRAGWSAERLSAEIAAIGGRTGELLARAEAEDSTPLDAAKAVAAERVAAGPLQEVAA